MGVPKTNRSKRTDHVSWSLVNGYDWNLFLIGQSTIEYY